MTRQVTSVTLLKRMDLNLKGIDDTLVSRAKMAAYGQEQTLKEWVLEAITEKLARKVAAAREAKAGETVPKGPRGKAAKGGLVKFANGDTATLPKTFKKEDVLGDPSAESNFGQTPQHDTKSCRVYGCGMCRVLGVKDAKRGLA